MFVCACCLLFTHLLRLFLLSFHFPRLDILLGTNPAVDVDHDVGRVAGGSNPAVAAGHVAGRVAAGTDPAVDVGHDVGRIVAGTNLAGHFVHR